MKKIYAAFLFLLGTAVSAFADDWMAHLPDRLYVSQVSIPGAHDCATGNGFGSGMGFLGNPYARTQDIDIATQWACGVRAFDLRPCSYDGYLNLNHGIIPTALRLEEALSLLRDSLEAHPTEFVVVHMRHESEGDQVDDVYETMLLELLQSDGLKDLFVDFRRDLTVADLRGKILLLSRDEYADKPVGGFILNWTSSINWATQTAARIVGPGSALLSSSPLYVQDFYDTHNEGDVDRKVEAINQMLDSSTTRVSKRAATVIWYVNFISAYSSVASIFGNEVSESDGYRDNAAHTNKAVIDYLLSHDAGPAGIILMDYAGVDKSAGYKSGTEYETRGKELVDVLVENNFKYLERINPAIYEEAMGKIEQLYAKLEEVQTRISEECADVAAEYAESLEAVKDSIDELKSETERLYAVYHLTESYTISTTGLVGDMDKILAAALEAQAAFDLASGISRVSVDGPMERVRIYSTAGEALGTLRPGKVNIIRRPDGKTKKVVVK